MAVGPDWLQFKHAMEASRDDIIHSPKGTTWKDHKYIRKENGRYVYESTQSDKHGGKGRSRKPNHEVRLSENSRNTYIEFYEKQKSYLEKEMEKYKKMNDPAYDNLIELYDKQIKDLNKNIDDLSRTKPKGR